MALLPQRVIKRKNPANPQTSHGFVVVKDGRNVEWVVLSDVADTSQLLNNFLFDFQPLETVY